MNTGRLAGVFYLGTFVTGMVALAAGANMVAANAISTVCYVAVVALFYVLFRPVNAAVSLVAALVGALGCAMNVLALVHVSVLPINLLAVFGVYCILVGWLIVRSTFVPHLLGVLMMIGGVSWLTFGVRAVALALVPYNYGPGIFAEGALTVWLLVKGARA